MKNKKLLVILATSLMICLVAGMGAMTYARYITSTKTGNQQATAADWGFVITVDASNLFGDAYNGSDGDAATVVDYASGVSIKADTDNKFVVAPGSKGSMTITISGKAEVRAALAIKQTEGSTINDIHIVNYNGAAVDYYPLTWTLKEEGAGTSSTGKLSDLLTGLVGTSSTLEANTEYNKNYTLSWEWPLETNDTNNMYDTIIGFMDAGMTWANVQNYVGELQEAEYANTNIFTAINFALDISVQQIQ